MRIVDLMADSLNRRLADKQLRCVITDAAKAYIVDNGFDPVYGARPLRRYMQKACGNAVEPENSGGRADARQRAYRGRWARRPDGADCMIRRKTGKANTDGIGTQEVRALPCVLPFKKEGRDSPAFVDKSLTRVLY